MVVDFDLKEEEARRRIATLVIGALGTVVVIALSLLIGLQFFELVLLLIVVGFCAMGYNQCILRGIMTAVAVYISTGVAATFYPAVAPYVGTILEFFRALAGSDPLSEGLGGAITPGVARASLAIAFVALTLVVWIVLEFISRSLLEDTTLPGWGILDRVGGMFVYFIVGFLIVSLLFNVIGYGGARRLHDRARLRRTFNRVLYLHYTAQSFWFPGRPPSIYVYDL
ncbi:MAG: hypothetical protein DRI48_04060 [Chloroflexi bacterium]|nr:MAG: hypothetical protein DRI48_04060 [Chloroflexota bacterium]